MKMNQSMISHLRQRLYSKVTLLLQQIPEYAAAQKAQAASDTMTYDTMAVVRQMSKKELIKLFDRIEGGYLTSVLTPPVEWTQTKNALIKDAQTSWNTYNAAAAKKRTALVERASVVLDKAVFAGTSSDVAKAIEEFMSAKA
jgi:hypothetical protein